MAIEYWIQIENRPWDLSPHNVDRMTGQNMQAVTGQPPAMVTLTSVVPGTPPRMVNMFNPLRDGANVIDALILRRYRPPTKPDGSDAWTVPDDRKINPWDLNEHNPGEAGTMGTIPGPVIECQLGDTVHVHFRNADGRVGKDVLTRTHSLHPHGFVFQTTSDGAYPLTPPDPAQPVGAEAAAWAGVGVHGQFKQGDRVPPGATFTYTWETFGWPSTAGVWLYHDHSICDMENIELGAIGIIVIHNNAGDPANEVDIRLDPNSPVDPSNPDPALVPGGSANGSPSTFRCFPFPEPPFVLPALLGQLGLPADHLHGPDAGPHHDDDDGEDHDGGDAPVPALSLRVGPAVLELSKDLSVLHRFCLPVYRTPPNKMLILQLYHSLKNAGMCINGRKYLGNTPTIVTGRDTKMRFGVVGMGSDTHTFHLHGHRWTIPGPDGNDPVTIQGSPQNHPVSQFEDTRVFGPANSLAFTIDGHSGSFMRAGGPAPDAALGEWHMHCHVLNHMMTGMMGSLLLIRGGEFAFGLPTGVPCPPDTGGTQAGGTEVHLTTSAQFSPQAIMINAGDTVTWKWDDGTDHSATSDTGIWDSGVKSGGPPFPQFSHTFTAPGTFPYHCVIHGAPGGVGMSGTVTVM
jgi:plastocyanin/FtsP/CotA-like multicopper oxidase with cupredoxin domain